MMSICVSLGGHPLAILSGNARHARPNLWLRGYDNSHSPESLEERDRDMGLETSAKRSSIGLKEEGSYPSPGLSEFLECLPLI